MVVTSERFNPASYRLPRPDYAGGILAAYLTNSSSLGERLLYRPESICRSRAAGGMARKARITFCTSGRGAGSWRAVNAGR